MGGWIDVDIKLNQKKKKKEKKKRKRGSDEEDEGVGILLITHNMSVRTCGTSRQMSRKTQPGKGTAPPQDAPHKRNQLNLRSGEEWRGENSSAPGNETTRPRSLHPLSLHPSDSKRASSTNLRP
jgi:hypothetical protein